MIDFIRMGGVPMYLLIIVTLVAAGIALRSALHLREVAAPDRTLEQRIDGVLFWGAYAALLGVLGTVVGFFQTGSMLQQAGEASSQLIWGGVRLALTTSIAGLVIFAVALIVWYALRSAYRGRVAQAT
jgi:hypothetical protein